MPTSSHCPTLCAQVQAHLCCIWRTLLGIGYNDVAAWRRQSFFSRRPRRLVWRPLGKPSRAASLQHGVCSDGLGLDRFHASPAQRCRQPSEWAQAFSWPRPALWRRRTAVCCGSRRPNRTKSLSASLEFPPRWRSVVDPSHVPYFWWIMMRPFRLPLVLTCTCCFIFKVSVVPFENEQIINNSSHIPSLWPRFYKCNISRAVTLL